MLVESGDIRYPHFLGIIKEIVPGRFSSPESNREICSRLFTAALSSVWTTNIAKHDPACYRGITLLNSMGKIFATIIRTRLTEWAEDRGLFPEAQFGFRENRRATDCVFVLNALIESCKGKQMPLYACFVDLRKAFDCVNHSLLWLKLVQLGISKQMLTLLQSMYRHAKSCVRISRDKTTNLFPCQKGVRQGCPFSPLLFTLFTSGLETELKRNKVCVEMYNTSVDLLMYADDIVLLSNNQ